MVCSLPYLAASSHLQQSGLASLQLARQGRGQPDVLVLLPPILAIQVQAPIWRQPTNFWSLTWWRTGSTRSAGDLAARYESIARHEH